MNKVIYLLPKEGEANTRPSFPSTASFFPACLLRRQQGLLPWQLPSDRHGNRHRSLQLATLPLGHLHGNGRDGGAAGAPRLRLRRVAGGGGHGSPACAAAEHRIRVPLAQALRTCQPVRPSGARLAGAAWRGRRCSAGRGPGASAFWCCCFWAYSSRPPRSAQGR